jgi:hypothetical protein
VRRISLFLISLILITGCSGVPAYQVNERAYVQIFGVSKTGEDYNVFIQHISDGETGITEGEGDTINAAIADAELSTGKKLFLGHMKLFIIGDGIDNLSKELEVFLSGDICPACPVVYAEKPSDITALGEGEGGFSADELLKVITVYAEQGKSLITPLTAVAASAAEYYTASPVPIVFADESGLGVGGVTFVSKNGIDGFLPDDDVYGLQLLTDNLQRGERVTVVSEFEGKSAAADILSAKVKKTASRRDGTVYFAIEVTLKTDITENPYALPETAIEEATRRYVSDVLYEAFAASVWQTELDTVGIAKLLRKSDNAAYEEFTAIPRETLSNCAIEITVH